MGNSSSSGRSHHDETVDFGCLTPQGVYTGPRDWNQSIVTQLIVDRKLAPFYRPLEDYEDSWDDDQILAARKEPQDQDTGQGDASITRAESHTSSLSTRSHHKRPSAAAKEPARNPEAAVYRGAIECPICFLYYPPNINYSRCCNQAICTECFVQIKRADPTTTHLVSEPACCPYCVQPNFGVVYTPPPWRAGIGSEGATPPSWPETPRGQTPQPPDAAPSPLATRRRKSFSADSPEVVTTDQVRPDWEAKLAAVRAAVTRRANRRIIMRQVGDRLIPVGVTSGRVHPLPTGEEGQGETAEGSGGADRGSRRSRRRHQNQDLNQLLGTMGLGGQDLEELMVMEAMRLSLLEHEEQQRREREAEAKRLAEQASNTEAPTQTEVGETAESAESSGAPSSTSTLRSRTSASPPHTPDGQAEGDEGTPGNALQRASIDHRSPSSPPGRGGRSRSRSHSRSSSSISIALQGATNTAVAVGSPSAGSPTISPSQSSQSQFQALPPPQPGPTSISIPPPAPIPLPTPVSPLNPSLSTANANAVSSSDTNNAILDGNPIPRPRSPNSNPEETSSDSSETTYNILLSRQGSSTSNKPLIEIPASTTTAPSDSTPSANGIPSRAGNDST